MPIPPKYPMTDFHEINLDYLLNKYFEIDNELKAQIGGLVLDNQFNKLRLLDKDGNEITSVTVAFATNATLAQTAVNATNAQNATLAARATEADNADMARYDAAGNQLTSYVKSVDTTENLIVFKDAYNRTIGSVSIVTGSIIDLDIYNTSDISETRSLRYTLDRMTVGDEVFFNSNYSAEQIADLFIAGSDIHLKHHYVSTDPDYNGKYSFNAPLYYDGLTKFIMMNTDHNKKYQLISSTTPGTIGIARID